MVWKKKKKKENPPTSSHSFHQLALTPERLVTFTQVFTRTYIRVAPFPSLSLCVLSKTAENEVKKKKSKSTRHFKVDEAGNIAQSVQPIYMWEDMK